MKKLLTLSPAKIFVFCGFGLLMTLGAFWHYQVNQSQLERMTVLNQGVNTCWGRISQTFTAAMIKDLQSPYINQGFMALSDECLSETIKSINPYKQNMGKGYETLNRLISEVSWFHEKTWKMIVPLVTGHTQIQNTPVAPLSERYSKMEDLKMSLLDLMDENVARIREVQKNDEFMMGAGLMIFVIALSFLSLQEFNRIQLQREIERESLNFLKAGEAHVAALMDKHIDRALISQNMIVTAQIFRDYHGDILESMTPRKSVETKIEKPAPKVEVKAQAAIVDSLPYEKTSLKEVLVSLQGIYPKGMIHISDVRDVQMNAGNESVEQMLNAAITKLSSFRTENKKIMISNQIHSDRTIINLFLAGATFTASDLEFASNAGPVGTDSTDMNLLILKEMVNEAGATYHLENKTDRQGKITGMNVRLILNRVSKDARAKNLISVVRGKKRDLTQEMMN